MIARSQRRRGDLCFGQRLPRVACPEHSRRARNDLIPWLLRCSLRKGKKRATLGFGLSNGKRLSQLLSDLCECELLSSGPRNHDDITGGGDE